MSKLDLSGVKARLAYYSGDRKTGSITLITIADGELTSKALPAGAQSGLDKTLKPILVGVAENDQVITLDPKTKAMTLGDEFPVDAFPAHVYSDPVSKRDWYMNDGDKETGNDTLNCGNEGSSVTVVDDTSSCQAAYLSTVCVGRGHHQAHFSYPSEHAPDVPRQAFVSNIIDGTISVVGNDPAQAETDLKLVATINLCEPEKEKDCDAPQSPNNAFPHGLAYSKVSGKVYNLNNGYGTVAVIDPITHVIEERFELKGCSNLFATPCGRYLIGRGADRKSDPNHVIAKLVAVDAVTRQVVASIELQDTYVSKYFFNPEGDRLYLTTSSSGSDEQQANIKADAMLVFDLNALPGELKLLQELRLGSAAGTLEFLTVDGKTRYVLASNSADGVVSFIDAASHQLVEKVALIEPVSHSRLWLLS